MLVHKTEENDEDDNDEISNTKIVAVTNTYEVTSEQNHQWNPKQDALEYLCRWEHEQCAGKKSTKEAIEWTPCIQGCLIIGHSNLTIQ